MDEKLDSRVAVLEAKHTALKETVEEIKNVQEKTNESLQGIMSRLDQWNGKIPYMANQIGEIAKDMGVMRDKIETLKDSTQSKFAKVMAILAYISGGGVLTGAALKVFDLMK
jgi:archaellum component FlaC